MVYIAKSSIHQFIKRYYEMFVCGTDPDSSLTVKLNLLWISCGK